MSSRDGLMPPAEVTFAVFVAANRGAKPPTSWKRARARLERQARDERASGPPSLIWPGGTLWRVEPLGDHPSESVGKACHSHGGVTMQHSVRTRTVGGAPMVWKPENRDRYNRRGERYPSDLKNDEWQVLGPLLPTPPGIGRPRTYELREIMNGIRYVLRYGIPWDAMPKDLPPSCICYDYWRLLSDGGHMDQINHELVMMDRLKAGREASPTLAIIDAQSVKCDAPHGERGYDAGKKVLGRKRHIAVDSDGRLLCVKVTSANVQDQNGGITLFKRLVKLCPFVKTVVVDGGYKTTFIDAVKATGNRVAEVVKRPDFAKGFLLLPKRWRVEQTIGALTIARRLKTDYESLIHVSAATILLASIGRLLASITMR